MSDHRKLAHLEEQLGEARYQVLIDPANTGRIKAVCDELLASALPTEITVGDRTYEILPILRGRQENINGHTMVVRAKEANAHLGKEDGEHLLAHKGDIPIALRGKVVFVFTDWPHPGSPGSIAFVCWYGARWVQDWGWLVNDWYGRCRVLRRKSK